MPGDDGYFCALDVHTACSLGISSPTGALSANHSKSYTLQEGYGQLGAAPTDLDPECPCLEGARPNVQV